MKIDLQTLEESIRNGMLAIAEKALQYGGKFSYNNKQYFAKRAADNSIEIFIFDVLRDTLTTLNPVRQQEFKNKVNLAKQSSDPQDRKFQIDDIIVEVKQVASGSFVIYTTLAPNTGSAS